MKLLLRPILSLLLFAGFLSACRIGLTNPTEASRTPGAEQVSERIAAKIFTAEAGIYSLSKAQLRTINMPGLLDRPDEIHLVYRGVEQAFWLEGQGEDTRLLFYAQPNLSRYLNENVYMIANHPLDQPGGSPPGSPDMDEPEAQTNERVSFQPVEGTIKMVSRVEENRVYLPQAHAADRWYWMKLVAQQSITQEIEIDPYLVMEAASILRVAVWSATDASISPDHHLQIALNGTLLADESWDGEGVHLLETQLPGGVLRSGKNQVEIIAPGDLGLSAEIYHLDWIEMEFSRQAVAVADRLAFESNGSALILAGFSGPVQVFDITDPDAVQRLDPALSDGQAFNGEEGRSYYMVAPQGAHQPVKLEPAQLEPDLASPEIAADYVALGPPELLQPLQPLLDWRASQGLKTLAVPWGAIVDQFNSGLAEPEAIQNFARHASSHWKIPPRYLLLVGDSSYDPLGYTGDITGYHLPASLVETVFGGETVSDAPLVQLDGDPLPDLAIGLVPARNPEQVVSFVQKTLGYERRLAGGELTARVVAIADGQEETFKQDAQAFLDLFPETVATELFAPLAGESGANQIIRGYLERQMGIVAYFGHGSINMWGKDRLFTTEDVAGLQNSSQPPIVFNLTCLTGLYTHPKVESLAEALLWAPESGAVAVLAPSSLTLPTDQSFLSRPLVNALLDSQQTTLGQAHLAARRAVPVDMAGTLDVMQTFMLFGDPALSLPFEATSQ